MKLATVNWRPWVGAPILVLFLSLGLAQEVPLGEPASFLRSNDRFAANLLNTTHEEIVDRNIVIAPLPVSLTFAALLEGSDDWKSIAEILSALDWKQGDDLMIPGRMLHARFAKPKPLPPRHLPEGMSKEEMAYWKSLKPEELWLSAAFLYRGQGSLAQDFIDRVTDNFGIEFRPVGINTPQEEIVEKNWDPAVPVPAATDYHDAWITSFTHLRTGWVGNTFIGSRKEKHDFTLRSGSTVLAEYLKSEMFRYPYAHTEDFEAVTLFGWKASILFILAPPGRDIRQLEVALAKDPEMVERLLKEQMGYVELPPFHFAYDTDLQTSIQKMGVKCIFADPRVLLRMVPVMGATVQGVLQKTEITVDQNGIRADAGTIVGAVYGGVMGSQSPFHMVLNRPFLFIIRDRATRALLFLGAVMNPTVS